MKTHDNRNPKALAICDVNSRFTRNWFVLGSLLVAALLPVACAITAEGTQSSAELPRTNPTIELPVDWQTVERLTFERMVAESFPGDTARAFDDETLGLLSAQLRNPKMAVRAAIWLARSRDPRSAEVLLAKLEERAISSERGGDAADVIGAAGLAEFAPSPSHTARLSRLASGETGHPDLEVRVECARSALLLGDDSPIRFLISVLLIGTNQGRESGDFWPAPLRSAWARERAAEILAWRSGLQNRYSADASIGDREREAARLALQLPISNE